MASSDQPLAASAPDMAPMRWPRSVRSATEASGMVEGEGSGATGVGCCCHLRPHGGPRARTKRHNYVVSNVSLLEQKRNKETL